MGIEDDKVDEIISAHTDTVNALKEQRDSYKEAADKLPSVQKELNDMKANAKEDPYKEKYEALQNEYKEYKDSVNKEKEKAAKEKAYRELVKDAGISEKRIDSIIKVTDIDAIEMDENGIKDYDNVKQKVREEWSDFIVTETKAGAKTSTPPKNQGGTTMSKEEIRGIKDPQARQKAMIENASLFGLE